MSEATSKSPKQLLADLIDAYAAAKMTGNEMLTKLSVTQLQAFLETHSVVPTPSLANLPEQTDEE